MTPRDIKAVLRKLLNLALAGDVQAARVLLDRVVGPAQPIAVADPLPVALDGADPAAIAREIAAARARGDITDAQVAVGLAIVEARARIAHPSEVPDLARRLLEDLDQIRQRELGHGPREREFDHDPTLLLPEGNDR